MNLNSKTLSILDSLGGLPWFQQVGHRVEGDVVRVCSWDQAMATCGTPDWESIQLQVRNRLCNDVNRIDYDRFSEWNQVTLEINKRIDVAVQDQLACVAGSHRLSRRFLESVLWDLTLSAQEAEFSDLLPPIFFVNNVLPWYRIGHFPCGWQGPRLGPGWDGSMPKGRLIVY